MAATDYITTVYTKIWTLLEAHTPFTATFGANNRIKWDAAARNPFKDSRTEADLPESQLTLGDFVDSAYTLTQGYPYRTNFVPATGTWTERIQQNYVLTLTYEDLRIGAATLSDHEILTALRKGGPRWGLDYVAIWGPVNGSRAWGPSAVDADGKPTGRHRLQTTMTIPVVMQFRNAAELIT